jgi:hypothetical protein
LICFSLTGPKAGFQKTVNISTLMKISAPNCLADPQTVILVAAQRSDEHQHHNDPGTTPIPATLIRQSEQTHPFEQWIMTSQRHLLVGAALIMRMCADTDVFVDESCERLDKIQPEALVLLDWWL